jgi:hypothetical protein
MSIGKDFVASAKASERAAESHAKRALRAAGGSVGRSSPGEVGVALEIEPVESRLLRQGQVQPQADCGD